MDSAGDTIKITANDGVISGTTTFYAINSTGDTIAISVVNSVIQGGTFSFYALDASGNTIKLNVAGGIVVP